MEVELSDHRFKDQEEEGEEEEEEEGEEEKEQQWSPIPLLLGGLGSKGRGCPTQ